MKSEFYRREKAAFLSYSSKDADMARGLGAWLQGFAELDIWFDQKNLAAGRTVATALDDAVRKCRAYILLLTPNSVQSPWVRSEWETATQQSAVFAGFKAITLVSSDMDPGDIPAPLSARAYIQMTGSELDGSTAARLLASLRPDSGQEETEHDVFVTRTWRDDESASTFADFACEQLVRAGFRLIGDEPRIDSDPKRLRDIISSCAAYFALIPPRTPNELRWLLQDLAVAESCRVPMVVVADPEAWRQKHNLRTPNDETVTFNNAVDVLRADMAAGKPSKEGKQKLDAAVELIEKSRKQPRNPYSVFYATDASHVSPVERQDINRVVGRITGRRCVYPDEIHGNDVQMQIAQAIEGSVATIADLSGSDMDTWVYAGVARGARRPVDLVTSEPNVRMPFLFHSSRPRPYASHLERVGLVHAALFTHRRFFLNQEVSRWS